MVLSAFEGLMKKFSKEKGLKRGSEVRLPGELYHEWVWLRKKLLEQAHLHETFPDYIIWDQYNKGAQEPIDLLIVDSMAKILAHVFAPTQPTHILGIMDAGENLSRAVASHLGIEERLTFAKKINDESEGKGGVLFQAKSYKTIGEKTLMVMPCYTPGSNVLVIDDVAAKFQVGGPVIQTLFQQGANVAGLGVGMDKNHQGWTQLLQQIQPSVLGFSAVRVATIDNVTRTFSLMDEAAALRVI